jgi:thiol-disulfide isomerase/thioredoxin
MKRKPVDLSWLLVLTVMALYLLTPLGFHVQVWVNRLLSPNPKIITGSIAENTGISGWRLRELNGGVLEGDSLEGQVVVINFWASWCPPCVAEMPSLEKLHQEFGERARFLFVARDQKDKVMAYLQKNNYDFPVYFEINEAPARLNNTSLPTTYILDKAGRILVTHTGAANWYSDDTRNLLDSLLIN